MKIKKIKLKNVKCFSEEVISLEKQDSGEPLSMCAFVGANGAGKSTILKAIVAAFSAMNAEYQGEKFTSDAIYNQEVFLNVTLELLLNENEKDFLDYDNSHFKIIYELVNFEGKQEDYLVLPEEFNEKEEEYTQAVLNLSCSEQSGLIMYYDPFRFVSDKNPAGPNLQQGTSAKEGALASNLDKSGKNLYRDLELKQWIVNMDYMRLKEPSRKNLSIYNHMIKAFDLLLYPLKFDNINQNGSLIFKNEDDNQNISIDMLSDGFKSIFSIVLDIIRRLALTPDSDNEEFYMKEAVILIDEIDCHIHPKWQRKLIPAFRELFPKSQFIFTTHSPYILDSLQTYEIKKVGEKNII